MKTVFVILILLFCSSSVILHETSPIITTTMIPPSTESPPSPGILNIKKKIIIDKSFCDQGVYVAGKCKMPEADD